MPKGQQGPGQTQPPSRGKNSGLDLKSAATSGQCVALIPVQSGHLAWNRDRVVAILVFAVPVWLAVHLALLPLRRRQGRGSTRRRLG